MVQGKCREFQASREVSVQVGMASGGMHGHVWTPPPVGVIKLNSDVAAKRDRGFTYATVTARESNGRICDAHVFKEKCNIPDAGECFGILKAAQMALHEGWREVVFESDAKLVVQNLNEEEMNFAHWSMSNYLFAIKSVCQYFNVFSFVWTPRKANYLVHEVCKWAARLDFAGTVMPDVLDSFVPRLALG